MTRAVENMIAELRAREEAYNATVEGWEIDLRLDLSHAILQVMYDEGTSQDRLADRCGMSKARFCSIVDAQADVTLSEVAQITHALGVKLELKL